MAQRVRYLGFAEEDSYNQSPAPDAILTVDIASSSLDTPADTQMLYQGGLSRGIRTHRPGFYAPTGNVVYAWDIQTIGWFLKWALGGYIFTPQGGGKPGDEQLNLHEIYGEEDSVMQSFCARVGKDLFEHVFSGCVVNTLSLSTEGEYCQLTADLVAAKDSKAAVKTLNAAVELLPKQYPLAFHELTASLIENGSVTDISSRVKSLNLEIGNNVSADVGRSIGSRFPRRGIAGARDLTISISQFYEELSMLERVWGEVDSVEPSAFGSSEYGLQLKWDSGIHGSLIMNFPRVINSQAQHQPSGRDELVPSISVRALMGAIELKDQSSITTDIYCRLENAAEFMGTEEEES